VSEYVVSLIDRVSPACKAAATALDGLSSALKGVATASDTAEKAQKKVKSASEKLGEAFSKSQSPMKAVEGIAGRLGAALNPVSLMLAAVGIAAAVSVGAVVAFGAALVKAAQSAIALSQARRQLIATFDVFTEGAGKKTVGALDSLARKLPFSKQVVSDWGKQLTSVGIQGNAMEKATWAAASSAAILGDKTGAAAGPLLSFVEEMNRAQKSAMGFQPRVTIDGAMIDRLGKMGVSVRDISSELKMSPQHMRVFGVEARKLSEAVQQSLIRKGGNALQIMGLDWDVITTKMGDGFSSLFKGMDDVVVPFMKQVKSLFGEFYEGSATMDVAGGVTKGVLGSILESATGATRAIHIGFLDAEIAVLKFAIRVAPIAKRVRSIWNAGGSDVLVGALKGIGVAALVAGGILAATAATAAAFFAPLVIAIAGVGYVLGELPGWITGALDAVHRLDVAAQKAAGNFIRGLADGITSGASVVVDAISGMADKAVTALKSVLRIKSPSQITAEVGVNVSRGMAMGIDRGAPEVRDSARDMGADAAAGASLGARSTSAAGGKSALASVTLKIEAGAFVIQVPTAAEALSVTEEKLTQLFERVLLELGLAPAVAR
jgi:hypothetical protein